MNYRPEKRVFRRLTTLQELSICASIVPSKVYPPREDIRTMSQAVASGMVVNAIHFTRFVYFLGRSGTWSYNASSSNRQILTPRKTTNISFATISLPTSMEHDKASNSRCSCRSRRYFFTKHIEGTLTENSPLQAHCSSMSFSVMLTNPSCSNSMNDYQRLYLPRLASPRLTNKGTLYHLQLSVEYSGGPLSGTSFARLFGIGFGDALCTFNSACMEALFNRAENAIYIGIEMNWRAMEALEMQFAM